ncbi:hypothetical protein EJB05_04548, partial [Eragrostis curvula]
MLLDYESFGVSINKVEVLCVLQGPSKKSLACCGAWRPSGVLIPGVYPRSSPNANSADIEFSLQLDVKDATGVAYQAFDGTPCMLW